MVRNFRKFLVVVVLKILLRLLEVIFFLDEMVFGIIFQIVMGDFGVFLGKVIKVVFCLGKYYYILIKERENFKFQNVVIICLEVIRGFLLNSNDRKVENFCDECFKYDCMLYE